MRCFNPKLRTMLGLCLSLGLISFFARADEPRAIVPVTHFTLTSPGTEWLNVSRALSSDDLKEKVVLLDFWSYCCVNCIQTLPEIAKLEKEFKDKLVVIGVHSGKFDNEKEIDPIRQAVLRYGIEHPVVNDKDFRIWKGFGVRSWPTLVLLRPNGEVEKFLVGEGHTAELRKAISELLKGSKVTGKLPIQLERDKVAPGEFFYPSKLAFDDASKTLFVSDSSHQQIAAYQWDPKEPARLKPVFRVGKSGEAGLTNGSYASARFRRPQGLAVGKNVLYVADTENHVIRKIDLKAKTVSTLAGTGVLGSVKTGKNLPAKSTALASPWDLAFHPENTELMIGMAGTHQLWTFDLESRKLSISAGTTAEGINDGLYGENTLAQPSGLSPLLGSLYFVDSESSSLRFYFEGYVKTLVGTGLFDFGFRDGDRKKAQMQHPLGLYADVTGVYIADSYNHAIRRYDPAKQSMETLIGDGKPGAGGDKGPEVAAKVRLNEPTGITKVAEGVFVISDTNNHRLMLWNRSSGKIERMKIEGEKMPEVARATDSPQPGEAVAARKRYSVRLPNVLPMADAKVNRASPEVKINLPERYKLNAEGPSFVRLFAGSPPKEVLVKEWKREDLQKSLILRLSDLKADTEYFMQGTFYYCLDAKNAVCEVASVSFGLGVKAEGTETIQINLTAAGKKSESTD